MEFSQASESAEQSEFRVCAIRSIAAAAAMLAAGAAILTSGQPAEASTGRSWERLARCESGGNWHIDTGNGFSGGLQLAHSTWNSFGGGAFAPRAARATRSQQIQVAERVLIRQGWGAWPSCSVSLGLNSAVRHRALFIGTARSTPPRHSRAVARVWVRHPNTEAKRYRTGRQARGDSLIINTGDTVSGLAFAHGCSWQSLYHLNRKVIGENPNLIYPGMQLNVPRRGVN
ncbi:transglycosylase family protein [Streptomyces sioyaensis]|uniref:transglycosylase family protein n=1 Tax=Streptomyces sioyaensis TaxID=67364 RepID=UPI0036E2037E